MAQLDKLVDALKKTLPADDPTVIEFEALALKGHAVASAQTELKAIFAGIANLDTAGEAKKQAMEEFNFRCTVCDANIERLDLSTLQNELSTPNGGTRGGFRGTTQAERALLEFMIKAAEINQNQLNQPHLKDIKNIMNYFVGNIYQSANLTENDLNAVRTFRFGPDIPDARFTLPPRETYIEANANSICNLSDGSTTCYQENGEAVQTAPPNTTALTTAPIR